MKRFKFIDHRRQRRVHHLNQQVYVQNLPDFDNLLVRDNEMQIVHYNSSDSCDSDDLEENQIENDSVSNLPESRGNSAIHPEKSIYMEAVFLSFLSNAGLNLNSAEIVIQLFNCMNIRFSKDPVLFPNIRHFWNKQSSQNAVHCYILCAKEHSHGPYVCEPKNFEPYVCEGESFPAALKSDNYFIHCPIREQLEKYLSSIPVDFWQKVPIERNEIDDIANGKLAMAVKDITSIQSWSKMTLTLHADEVSCSGSSTTKIFPVFISINELKPFHRKKFFFIVGLFVGKSKPRVESFLGPICLEILSLSTNPVTWCLSDSSVSTTFHLIGIIADAPMRAYLRNVKQYNHLNGCDWCLIQASSANGARVFPNLSQKELETLKRTKKDFFDFKDNFQNEKNQNSNNPRFKGLNGLSPLLLLKDFDIVGGNCVEPMHCISLGVFRNLFIKGIISSEDSSIFEKNVTKNLFCTRLSDNLKKIKVPSETTRAPREIDIIKFWKSNEYDSLLAYYFFSTTKGLLKTSVINLVVTLSRIYDLAHRGPINDQILQELRNLVEEFQHGISNLFGTRFLSYNLHILSHLADSIQNLGPNCNSSSYPLEDHMGLLKEKVRRHSHIGPALLRIFMNDFKYAECIETKVKTWNLNLKEKKYFGIKFDESLTSQEEKSISQQRKEAVCRLLNQQVTDEITLESLKLLKSISYEGIRYSTRDYCEKKQRNDSYICRKDEFYEINLIAQISSGKIIFIYRKLSTKEILINFPGFTGFFSFKLRNTFEIIKTDSSFICVDIDQISAKCIYIGCTTFHHKYHRDHIVKPFLKNK